MIWSDFLPRPRRMEAGGRRHTGHQDPVGISARGSEGVSALVKQTAGAIGYVEVIYAKRSGIAQGQVQNSEGAFVSASIAAIAAAAAVSIGRCRATFASLYNAWQRGLSYLVIHLDAALRELRRPPADREDGGVHALGAQRWTALCAGPGVRAVAGRGGDVEDGAAQAHQGELSDVEARGTET